MNERVFQNGGINATTFLLTTPEFIAGSGQIFTTIQESVDKSNTWDIEKLYNFV